MIIHFRNTIVLILIANILQLQTLLYNLGPCEKQQMAKIPNWRQFYTATEFERQLKQLCKMAKSWNLTAKLNIPQLNDPKCDPKKTPIQLNLLPEHKVYIEKSRHCKKNGFCAEILTEIRYIGSKKFNKSRIRRQAPPPKRVIRKEYHSMSEEERQTFHDAVIALKNKIMSNGYNAYDLHASLHTAAYAPQAHMGCGFIPFHRVYLLMFEKQLQEVSGNKSLAIPYWDSTLDSTLPEPCESAIFSEEMLGPSKGIVNEGPFANFHSPLGAISRNCNGRRTVKVGDFNMFKQITNFSQFCYCVSSRLELVHGTIHTFVSGIMNNLDKASYDPTFWLHHAFIDKMYEDIQANWKVKADDDAKPYTGSCLSKGIDRLDEPMLPFGRRDKATGKIIGLKNKDGLSAKFTEEYYTYAPSPSCSDQTCTGKFLFCDNNICKSRIRNEGRCDKHLFDLLKDGINACLPGYVCRPKESSDQYTCQSIE